MSVVQSSFKDGTFLQATDNGVYFVDAGGAPTAGTYKVGDLALCAPVFSGVAPTNLSPMGWRCTVAGTPGTWVPVGPSTSNAGTTAVSAATSITPTAKSFLVSGTTQITTIVATGLQAGDQITLIPADSSTFTTATGGNIALGSTAVRYKALIMTWDGTSWYPSY